MSQNHFTKYETARILGARALQISMNAPILLKLSAEELEKINYDALKIASLEFEAGILPITVKRPMPKRREEKIIIPKKLTKEEEEQKLPEKEKVKEEEKFEEELLKEVEGSEIMEMASPEDEVEEETETTIEEG